VVPGAGSLPAARRSPGRRVAHLRNRLRRPLRLLDRTAAGRDRLRPQAGAGAEPDHGGGCESWPGSGGPWAPPPGARPPPPPIACAPCSMPAPTR
jgi:hypothetical protein